MDLPIEYKTDSIHNLQQHILLRFVVQWHQHRLDLQRFSNDDFESVRNGRKTDKFIRQLLKLTIE